MRCEGVIAERTVPVGSHFETEDGERITGELPAGVTLVKVIDYQTTQQHRCEANATSLSRSMREAEDGSWQREGADWVYCAGCFVPGQMHHQDGRVTQHPAMSVDEYQGGDHGPDHR